MNPVPDTLAPIIYIPRYVALPDLALVQLRDDLRWERRLDAPRGEYYSNDHGAPYTYGRGRGVRTYEARPWHPFMLEMRGHIEKLLRLDPHCKGTGPLDVCFLNRYENERDHLGWHADDSPEMDHERPIAIISLGAERDIEFRLKDTNDPPFHRQRLAAGSLCVMPAGMQRIWEHRIGKASFKCGPRISLTYRGFVKPPTSSI